MNRRSLFTAGFAAVATISRSRLVASAGLAPKSVGLRSLAARKGLRYGCSVQAGLLSSDLGYAELIAEQASTLVPEGELKRNAVQKSPGVFDYSAADAIAGFAAAHGMAMRGHNFCWYASNPPWLEMALAATSPATAKVPLLTGYITSAMAHFRGRIDQWDVVNEPVDPGEEASDGMRVRNPWSQAFGEHYIDIAYHTSRDADPSVKLFLNEFGIESDVPWQEKKRTALLKLLDRMKGRGVPLDGIGVQSHLKVYKERFDQDLLARFLRTLAGYGVTLAITEFDVMDRGGPVDPGKRDADVAALTRAYLDVALDNPAVGEVLTWGIEDRYSWLSSKWASDRWPEGQLARGLPFDMNEQSKPMYRALAGAFAAARSR